MRIIKTISSLQRNACLNILLILPIIIISKTNQENPNVNNKFYFRERFRKFIRKGNPDKIIL